MTNIYILELEDGRFYVGKSDNVEQRFLQHQNGAGSAWTTKYKPVAIRHVHTDASAFDEDKYVKEYMAEHGIDNVRGGSYVQETLPDEQRLALQREIRGAHDLCTRCGRKGHFVKGCYAKTDSAGAPIARVTAPQPADLQASQTQLNLVLATALAAVTAAVQANVMPPAPVATTSNANQCFRCGRAGHAAAGCYAKTDARGKPIAGTAAPSKPSGAATSAPSAKFKTAPSAKFKGAPSAKFKSAPSAPAKAAPPAQAKGKRPSEAKDDKPAKSARVVCFKCGRGGHTSTACYAGTHANGHSLKKGK